MWGFASPGNALIFNAFTLLRGTPLCCKGSAQFFLGISVFFIRVLWFLKRVTTGIVYKKGLKTITTGIVYKKGLDRGDALF
jgi:hypothetical protein